MFKGEAHFEPFVRLERSSNLGVDGVGLGLTIAKMLLEKNEAALTLRNREDGGLEACLAIRRGVAKTPNSLDQLDGATTNAA